MQASKNSILSSLWVKEKLSVYSKFHRFTCFMISSDLDLYNRAVNNFRISCKLNKIITLISPLYSNNKLLVYELQHSSNFSINGGLYRLWYQGIIQMQTMQRSIL